jgi:uncharacterized protein
MPILFSWNEKKRRRNLAIHGLDFKDACVVFEGITFTFEDDRFDYPEHRFVTLGLLADVVVSIVHTETPDQVHVISFRRATRHESIIFFKSIQGQGTAEGEHESQ